MQFTKATADVCQVSLFFVGPKKNIYLKYFPSDIFLEVNNQSMKPLDEYMLFTKTDAEKILVLNPTGVRSAQCNAQFESIQKLIDEPLLNISLGTDKNWVEDSPARNPYKSIFVDNDEKEEQTQFVFIVLISLFIIIIIGCCIELLRTNRQHKKRIERETDESIIWSKEQATKMHETPGPRKFSYKPVAFEDVDAKPGKSSEPLVSILKNGSTPKQTIESEKPYPILKDPNGGIRGELKKLDYSKLIGHDSIIFAESQLLDRDSIIGSQNSLLMNKNDDDDNSMDADDMLVRNDPSSLANLAPMSSISEVTLDKFS